MLFCLIISLLTSTYVSLAAGANGWYNAEALEFTRNPLSNEVVLEGVVFMKNLQRKKVLLILKCLMPNG